MNTRFLILVFLYFACLHRGRSINAVERIINGSKANIESVPYMLSLMLYGKYACCAAIINEYWAVTAAHCLKVAKDPSDISVNSGSSILYDGIAHNVNDVLVHEEYDETTNDYDIAVIKVTPPFIYDSFTKPVYLAQDDSRQVFIEWGIVCGWGYYTKTDGDVDPILAEKLRCAPLPLIEKEQCQQDYEYRYTLTPRMTCYGFQNGAADTCKGDSGGALVNKENILLGTTSWGDDCGKTCSPGVYTDAVLLRDWIKNKTGMEQDT